MSDPPFRQPGLAGSSTLSALAASAPDGVPDQSGLLGEDAATSRRLHAFGLAPGVDGLMLFAAFACMVAFMAVAAFVSPNTAPATSGDYFGLAVIIIGALGALAAAIERRGRMGRRRDDDLRKELSWADSHPFPVTGYASWLVCDRPLLDLRLVTAVERRLFADAVRAIDPAIDVEVVDPQTMRLALPPVQTSLGKTSIRHGNVPLLRTVFERLVLPLHNDGGVERVTMGGLVEDRPGKS